MTKKFKEFISESEEDEGHRIPPHAAEGDIKNYRHHTENVPIAWLKKLPGNGFRHSHDDINKLGDDMHHHGVNNPLIITVGKHSRTAKLGEGNHRLEALHRKGYTHAPARVIVGHKYGSEHGEKANYHHDLIPKDGEYFKSDAKPSEVFHSLKGKVK